MSFYFVATYNISDRTAYEPYPALVGPLLARHGGEVLVADYGAKTLEGTSREVCVVIRFASRETALSWYNDPDYAGPRGVRMQASSDGVALFAAAFARQA
ncbi:DUF1330 domain-containing protein [Burkholderia cenocepacia]|uniref:DUF1330 domain-containing protein n=1 Tax=Burkholderia cenocepacia TaxID=95486 RepID=UPI002AB63280|nr:DUF1330 domain-containing protein [Burkholderia cenocepacia]